MFVTTSVQSAEVAWRLGTCYSRRFRKFRASQAVAEISHAGYLVENLKPPASSEPGLEGHFDAADVNQIYLPGKLHGQDNPCPEGFVLRRLEPQHLDYVVSKWYHDMREKSMYLLSYFDHMIQHCETAAIFRADDPTKPVSWSMQYPYGQIGIGFTHEEYRKKGLISIPCREISKKIIAGGDLPEGNTDNPTLLKRDGFLDMYTTIWLEVKRTEL